MNQGTKPDPVDRAMRWIGDLDHPFYSDERQRYVWYEASAIGFQLFVLIQILMIGGAMVVIGRASLPYLMFVFPPFVVGTLVAEFYARKHNAPYLIRWSDMRRSRGLLALGIAGLYLAGVLRITFERDAAGNIDPALLIGAIAGFGGLALGTWWRSRQAAASDQEIEE